MSYFARASAAFGAVATVVLFTSGPALAHEQRQVGAYQLTVGWAHEPAYTGTENAVQIFIKDAKGAPVDDLGSPPTLKVTVSTGSQTSDPLELKPSFDSDTGLGTHGEFDASVVPTAPGNFTFHFTGTINGQAIEEKFTSSDKTFDPVTDPTSVEFPAKSPTPGQIAASLGRLSPRVDAASAVARSGKDRAGTASILAVVGIIVGAAGVALALGVGATSARRAGRQ